MLQISISEYSSQDLRANTSRDSIKTIAKIYFYKMKINHREIIIESQVLLKKLAWRDQDLYPPGCLKVITKIRNFPEPEHVFFVKKIILKYGTRSERRFLKHGIN